MAITVVMPCAASRCAQTPWNLLTLSHLLARSLARTISHSKKLAHTLSHSLTHLLARTPSLSLELAHPVLQNHSVFTHFFNAILQMNPFAT